MTGKELVLVLLTAGVAGAATGVGASIASAPPFSARLTRIAFRVR